MMRAWTRVLVPLVVLGLANEPANAAPPRAEAERHLKLGVKLLSENRDQEALDEFVRAHELDPSPKALAQMGLAEVSLRRWKAAEEHLRAALAAAEDQWISRNRVYIEEQLAAVSRHFGHLSIEGPAGATVLVDGEPRGSLPLPAPLRLAEGSVTVEAQLTGRTLGRQTVDVAAESSTAARFAAPLPSPPAQPRLPSAEIAVRAAAAPPASAVSAALPWAAMMSGLTTGVAGILAVGLNDKASKAGCEAAPPCETRKGREILGFAAALSGTPAFVFGGAGLLGTGVAPRTMRTLTMTGTLMSVAGGGVASWLLLDGRTASSSEWPAVTAVTVAAVSGVAVFIDLLAALEPPPRPVAVLPIPGGLALAGKF